VTSVGEQDALAQQVGFRLVLAALRRLHGPAQHPPAGHQELPRRPAGFHPSAAADALAPQDGLGDLSGKVTDLGVMVTTYEGSPESIDGSNLADAKKMLLGDETRAWRDPAVCPRRASTAAVAVGAAVALPTHALLLNVRRTHGLSAGKLLVALRGRQTDDCILMRTIALRLYGAGP
jgi:hypothetical protein